jgi:7,8-dihydroneopterin aldolase/epimerase/oxygenase
VDTIFIRELEAETVIGVYDWERRIRQSVIIDVEMDCDARRAAATDTIEATLDYKSIAARIVGFAGESRFALVETLAERIAQVLIAEFGVAHLRLSVRKPGALAGCGSVGVTIERGAR